MEGLAPPLELLMGVKRGIEQGRSIKMGIVEYIKHNEGEFSTSVLTWLAFLEQGRSPDELVKSFKSPYRRALLTVLEKGLQGESVYNTLMQLEEEIVEACGEEINDKLARLPFILMIPLLLFQFPAFLALLFGPLMNNLFHSLGSG
ncbi:hypothetical protein BDW_13975 [Bdellovibrio bacteriovorus W]|nr:hypothetical protein BDW_13975 [Bdellovibrio bacteriovorus W]